MNSKSVEHPNKKTLQNRKATGNKRLSEKAYESEKLLRLTINSIPAFVAYVDRKENYVYANKAYSSWYDLTEDEIRGKSIKELASKESYEKGSPHIKKALKGEQITLEFSTKNKAGNLTHSMIEYMPDFDENKKVRGFIILGHDITERKEMEIDLKESEEFNRSLLESSPDAISGIDLDGNIISMNQKGQALIEVNNFDELKGTSWLNYWSKTSAKLAKKAIETAIGGKIGHFQGFSITAKGNKKWWDVLIAPVMGAQNKPERLVSVSRDITRIKHLEKQREDFIGMATHELKTPVTTIKGYAQLLQYKIAKFGDPVLIDSVKKMDLQLDKLISLIGDLLDVTKTQAGKLQFYNEDFDFNELVKEIIDAMQRITTKNRLLRNLSKVGIIHGDRERIGQVITNFISNSIKYSPETSKIKISSRLKDGSVILSVKDLGVGIKKEELDRIFEQFYRVKGTDEKFVQGLGLGLYISSEIIKRQGGKIWVKSTYGKGSTFSFSIPVKRSQTN